MLYQNENTKIAVNSIIIFIRLCVVSLINILLSRVVLDALGASDYGLYSVIGGIVLVLNVVNSSMTSTTYRYIAYELGKINGNPNKIFNTSLSIHFLFSLGIILVGLPVGVYYINHFLNAPINSIGNARFILYMTIASTAVNTLIVPFQGLLVAFEDFKASAIIDIISNIFKIGVIFLFIYSSLSRVRFYCSMLFCYTLFSGCLFVCYSKIKHKEIIRFNPNTDKRLYKEMLSFSGWTLIGASANVCKTQGSAIVVNYFFGTIVNSAYAIAHQVEAFISLFSQSLGNAAVPQITKHLSCGDINRSYSLTFYISKYTYFLMAIVAFPFLLETDFFLSIWLKNVPPGCSTFCKYIVLGALFNCLGAGISSLINASGRIRSYQIVVNSVLLLGLPLCCLMYGLGCSQYTIVIIYAALSLLISIIKLIMAKIVVNVDVKSFLKVSYSRIVFVSIPFIMLYCLYDSSCYCFSEHLVGVLICEVLLVLSILLIGLDSRERLLVKRYLKNNK